MIFIYVADNPRSDDPPAVDPPSFALDAGQQPKFFVVDTFNDPNNSLFGYGLPTVGFSDNDVTRATQNTGFAADVQTAIGSRNVATFGYDYRFSRKEHVSGACQFFRRECFEAIGGYVPREIGGVDHLHRGR